MKSKTIKWIGIVGFFLILVVSAGVISAAFVTATNSIDNAQGLLIAFAGAFFAYIFVRIGELFSRISAREKLNLDTLVEIQYVLNDQLNRIDINIKLIEVFVAAIDGRWSTINTMRFKPIPHGDVKLRDLKNLDYINELFNYFVDIEKINDGLGVVQEFARNLINSVTRGDLTAGQQASIQAAYAENAAGLKDMLEDSKKLLVAADKDCEELIAKGEYVYETRNKWLSLAIPWFSVSHYNKKDLKARMPKIRAEIKKSRNKVTKSSVKQISKTLGKKTDGSK